MKTLTHHTLVVGQKMRKLAEKEKLALAKEEAERARKLVCNSLASDTPTLLSHHSRVPASWPVPSFQAAAQKKQRKLENKVSRRRVRVVFYLNEAFAVVHTIHGNSLA